MEEDLPPGDRLIECFRPFIEYLVASGISRRMTQEHVDNMWALGGEFITELNYCPSLRKRPVDLVLKEIIRYGGPLLRHADEGGLLFFDFDGRLSFVHDGWTAGGRANRTGTRREPRSDLVHVSLRRTMTRSRRRNPSDENTHSTSPCERGTGCCSLLRSAR